MAIRKSCLFMPHSASEKHIVKRSWMPAPFFLFPLQSRIPCCETFWLRCGMWHVACCIPPKSSFFCLLFSITDESLGFTCVSFTHGFLSLYSLIFAGNLQSAATLDAYNAPGYKPCEAPLLPRHRAQGALSRWAARSCAQSDRSISSRTERR